MKMATKSRPCDRCMTLKKDVSARGKSKLVLGLFTLTTSSATCRMACRAATV